MILDVNSSICIFSVLLFPFLNAMKETLRLLKICVSAAQDKKADSIVVIDLKADGSAPTDYFVVCSAFSDVQARAIAQGIVRATTNEGISRPKTEGEQQGDWVLLDYFDVVVNVFKEEARGFYKLEKMWGTFPQYVVHDDGSFILKEEFTDPEYNLATAIANADTDDDSDNNDEVVQTAIKVSAKKSVTAKAPAKKASAKKPVTAKASAKKSVTAKTSAKKPTAKKSVTAK
jgi:ribosome-associated protein